MLDLCVVTYNAKSKLERLLSFTKTPEHSNAYRFYFMDNNSSDGSAELLGNGLPELKGLVTLSKKNQGYALACNALAKQGNGDIIGLLNGDVWFEEQDLLEIQQAFDENPHIAAMGPKQVDEVNRITHAGIFGTNTHPRHRGWKAKDPQNKMYKDFVEAVTVSGSAYFIRRSVWEELSNDPLYVRVYEQIAQETIELLEDNIFLETVLNNRGAFLPTPTYFEETFCSYNLRRHGHKVFYNGNITMGHSWHGSIKIGSKFDLYFRDSKKQFRWACDQLGIERD